MVLGRLAVDRAHQRQGLAKGMLREALLRTATASRIAGLRMLIVHPTDDAAAAFYARYGFLPFSPKEAAATTQYLPVETLAALASAPP
jgi:ribosomal protein S18 acetylase RimI-like enzyme